jgi:hypothetical protein
MTTSRFEYGLRGIGAILKDDTLGVPIYQRSYSWDTAEVHDYWSDLSSSLQDNASEYFLGTIVLTTDSQGDSRKMIIDGQQRLVTTALLLAAIRDEYSSRGEDKRAGMMNQKFLVDGDLLTGEEQPKLTLNSEDDTFFRGLLLGDNPSAVKPSHSLIESTLASFRESLSLLCDAAGAGWEKALLSWVKYLTEEVKVIVVTVASEADAFLIFETLNARGADLTIADLLKNYLFGRAKSKLEVVRDGWMQTLGALDMTAETPLFTTFLRNYWSSRHGATRERDLYRLIKEQISTPTQATEFISDLQKAARLFAALRSSDHEFWADLGSETKANVETLIRLDLEQNRPMLLAALQHLPKAEIKKLLRAAVAWSVRGLVVGGIGGGVMERAYCQTAMHIRDGSLKTAADIRTELSVVIPTDAEFQTAFETAHIAKSSFARYCLRALERHASGVKEPELVANSDENELNLEHVLPRNFKLSEWPFVDDDDAKAHVYRLGNMVLLKKGPNDKLGNKPWSSKQPVLATSALKLTQSAATFTDWDASTVLARQSAMAASAVEIWPK